MRSIFLLVGFLMLSLTAIGQKNFSDFYKLEGIGFRIEKGNLTDSLRPDGILIGSFFFSDIITYGHFYNFLLERNICSREVLKQHIRSKQTDEGYFFRENKIQLNESMRDNYVTGLTPEGISAFCNWLNTKKMNSEINAAIKNTKFRIPSFEEMILLKDKKRIQHGVYVSRHLDKIKSKNGRLILVASLSYSDSDSDF